jgi:hypothetical protein
MGPYTSLRYDCAYAVEDERDAIVAVHAKVRASPKRGRVRRYHDY